MLIGTYLLDIYFPGRMRDPELSIKLFEFSSILLCNLYFVHLYGQFTSDPRFFMIIDPCSCIVLCYFDPIGTL